MDTSLIILILNFFVTVIVFLFTFTLQKIEKSIEKIHSKVDNIQGMLYEHEKRISVCEMRKD